MTATGPGHGRNAPARPRALVPAFVVLTVLAALAVLAVAASRVPVLVHRCVAGDGLAGVLGLRLALLRPDGACPSGTLALGGEGAHAAGIVVLVAAPVLALHLVLAGTGAGVLALAAGLVRALGRALARVLPVLPSAAAVPAVGRVLRPVASDEPAVVAWLLPTVGLRGPPAAV